MSRRLEAIYRWVGFAARFAWRNWEIQMTARISRRGMLALGAGSLLGAPALVRSASAQTRTVYVNSYGGVWESSWRKAFFEPFTAQTGIAIKTVPGVSFAKLKAQVQTRNFEWDVINLGDVEYGQAVLEGLLEKVDKAAAKTDQLPPHMVRDYGITSYSLGTNLVYRKDKFPNGGPQSWADFWDAKRFPGPRCMYDRSYTCLAFALLADGVPVDKLYPMDLDRAFRKLSELKPHIKVWWREGSQSQQLIRDGEVDMIAMWSGDRSDRGQGAGRAGLEPSRDLPLQPVGAARRSQRQGGVGILQFRRPGQAPGGVRDDVALWPRQSGCARADDGAADPPGRRADGQPRLSDKC